MENKTPLMSGKLTGLKTIESEFNQIKEPDEIEKFLKDFISKKFEIETENSMIFLNDDQDFLEQTENLTNEEAVSINVNENFSKLYLTTKDKVTYVVRMNKISSSNIASFISKEKPVKYILNSFSFVKWCNAKSIDLRNVYDIPTYIKLLTNNVDPFMSISEYLKKYTEKELKEDDNSYNAAVIGNFVLQFGTYLSEFVTKFSLSSVSKLINENSYFEANSFDEAGLSKIRFSYSELSKYIEETGKEKAKEYGQRAYIISPLGRIALKFGKKDNELVSELYNDDIEMMVLNELYNNNIKVSLLAENLYEVTCTYKNFTNVMSVIIAILNDIFYTMFQQKVDIKLECIVS